MANIGDAWHAATSKRVGTAVAGHRKRLGMTAQQLAQRCAELGAPIHRTTITKIENGRPRFDLGELIVLAAALSTTPVTHAAIRPQGQENSVSKDGTSGTDTNSDVCGSPSQCLTSGSVSLATAASNQLSLSDG